MYFGFGFLQDKPGFCRAPDCPDLGLHLFCRGDLDRGNRAAELQNVWLKRTAPRDGALPVIIIFTSNHIATLQTTTQMKIIQTFTTLAVLAIAFSAAEGRVLRGGAAAAGVDEDISGVVGRPLTPVSVAGSARRVSRRTARRNSR